MSRPIAFLVLAGALVAGACATGASGGGGDNDDSGAGASGAGQSGGTMMAGGDGGTAGAGAQAGDMGGSGGSAGAGGAGGTSSSGGGGGAGPTVIWINEIHYDNTGTDAAEGIEVAGSAGLALGAYQLVLYSSGTVYDTVALGGTLADQQNGFGTSWVPIAGLQNGPSDGVALVVAASSTVVQLLSYEGTFTAADGPAAGAMAVDIGIAEDTTTPVGQSLQLVGTGGDYASFTWGGPSAASAGQPNAGQTLQ
jgi:hypothetical protein